MLAIVNESVQTDTDIDQHEDELKEISDQIKQLKNRIKAIHESQIESADLEERLIEIQKTIDERYKNMDKYDDSIVHQMIECIKVYGDGRILIIFGGGIQMEERVV